MGARSIPALPVIPLSPAGQLQGRQHVRKTTDTANASKIHPVHALGRLVPCCPRCQGVGAAPTLAPPAMASLCEHHAPRSSHCTPRTTSQVPDQCPNDCAIPGTISLTPQTTLPLYHAHSVWMLELKGTSSCFERGISLANDALFPQNSQFYL